MNAATRPEPSPAAVVSPAATSFLTQAVALHRAGRLTEAEQMASSAPAPADRTTTSPYTPAELRDYLDNNAAALRQSGGAAYAEIGDALDRLSEDMDTYARDLERLELRLTVLEEKMLAIARAAQTAEEMVIARQALDAELRPYRSKMSAGQLALLEKQYLERRLLERHRLPRLSLFYLR